MERHQPGLLSQASVSQFFIRALLHKHDWWPAHIIDFGLQIDQCAITKAPIPNRSVGPSGMDDIHPKSHCLHVQWGSRPQANTATPSRYKIEKAYRSSRRSEGRGQTCFGLGKLFAYVATFRVSLSSLQQTLGPPVRDCKDALAVVSLSRGTHSISRQFDVNCRFS